MSRQDEIFNALSDAMAAYRREPELEAKIKSLEDDNAYLKLELEEANSKIERMRNTVCNLEDTIVAQADKIETQNREIYDFRDRNEYLSDNLSVAKHSIDNLSAANTDSALMIEMLRADRQALEARLEDAKGYGQRLAEMLKSFGQSIASAVAVPEVTEDKPFPVVDPVGLSGAAHCEDTVGGLVESSEVQGTVSVEVTTGPTVRKEPIPAYENLPYWLR